MNVKVMLWGKPVGYLYQENGAIIFTYDKDFLKSGIELSPLQLPLREGTFSFSGLSEETYKGLAGVFADSLPDKFGSKIIERYLEVKGRSLEDFSALERLGYTGSRGMGALEYIPDMFNETNEIEKVSVDDLSKLAEEILSETEQFHISKSDTMMAQMLRVSSSVGGARAKALIAIDNQTGDIYSGQIAKKGYSYWLLKFGGVTNNKDHDIIPDEGEYTKVEYAYYLMAKDSGIEMNECRLYEENGSTHFMTKRFDRTDDGQKLHMVSLCGMAHMDFMSPRMYSYEQAAIVMKKLRLSHKELEQLYRRMVFNECAVNYDDHTKNISFLMDKTGKWRLSPAYDVTYSYNPKGIWTSAHQMLINGKSKDITMEDLLESARSFGISKKDAQTIITIVQTTVNNWELYGKKAGLSEKKIMKIKKRLSDVLINNEKMS